MCTELNASRTRKTGAINTGMEDTNTMGDTVRIRRPSRVFTNERGHTIWMSDVEPVELEIELDSDVSTDPYDSCRPLSN